MHRALSLLLLLSAGLASAKIAARKEEVFLPKYAKFCERGLTDNKQCSKCNQDATVGAAGSVNIQVGGCTSRRLEESNETGLVAGDERSLLNTNILVAQYTPTGIAFFKPLTLTTNLGVTGNSAVGGNLAVAGTTTSTGDLTVGADKFKVTAGTGDTVVGGTTTSTGDLTVGASKFTVNANTGTIEVEGTAVLKANLIVSGGVKLDGKCKPCVL